MSKEIYISTTPHETRLAIVEDEQLAEIYYERENEYTLAGSIYNGKVTRVLPGMQSSFVDIGLERDAFLYVTDFMEEQGETADFESDSGSRKQHQPAQQPREASAEPSGNQERSDRGDRPARGDRNERGDRSRRNDRGERRDRPAANPAAAETESTPAFDEPIAPAPTEDVVGVEAGAEGSRRWRGRRGRRRGRGSRDEQPTTAAGQNAPAIDAPAASFDNEEADEPVSFVQRMDAVEDTPIEIDLTHEPAQPADAEPSYTREGRGGRGRDRRGRGDRERGPRREIADRPPPEFDNSYAGYLNEDALPEASGEPIVLPGESIRKYRDPAEVAAEDAEAKRNAPHVEILTVAAPTIEIVGWDGGAVLPGETLGRHRNRGSERTSPREQDRNRDRAPREPREPRAQSAPSRTPAVPYVAPTPIQSEETFAAPVAPEEPAGLTAPTANCTSAAAVEAAATADLGALPGEATQDEPNAEPIAEATSPVAETEYEPVEGASAATGDNPRRDLRRFEQPAEPEGEADAESAREIAGETPDQTTYDLNAAADETPAAAVEQAPAADPVEVLEPTEPEFTSLQSDGEMFSSAVEQTVEQHRVADLPAQDQPEPASPIAHEGAVHSDSAPASEPVFHPAAHAADEPEGSAQNEIHAYGDGDFHEEEIDEDLDGDDSEYQTTAGSDDGEPEEYEEETLEGTADFGSLIQEMSQDSLHSEDDEDDEEETSNAGGFTEADFGGEGDSDEEEDAPAEVPGTSSNGDQRPQRDGHRKQGGGTRDRRGGRSSGGGERGRGRRQSMQTTDLPAINELLKPGQEILVQIAKEPIAKKGARITSHIALPGRFLVFMPTVNHTGVSRKISSEEERRRLKTILLSEKGDAQGGFIVRTAADGASEEELRNDLRFLIHLWADIKMRSESSKSPALIYHDLNLVERILRDQVTDNFSAIWVDTEQEYERVLRFLQRFQPSLVRRVKLYTKETPLFEHFGVTAEIDKALKSKVWLKSGGSIVINQTEALVAIDINTGKYVGKTARLEDTILKTNLDAIPEIVRQIRLRDLGGIIVIDFIDMDERKNRAKVMQTLEDAMRNDRAPSKILPFNDFGLVIMTRKRVKQSLERTLCMPDPVTEGTGMIKSPITIANEIYIEMRKMHRHLEKSDVMLRVHPEVVKTLKANGGKRLQELEEMTRKTILVKSDPTLNPEAFDIH